MSAKDFFSKIGFVFSCVGAVLAALFLGKKLHNNGKRTERDISTDRPNDDASKRADRISEEAGESAKRIHAIIERIKGRERETPGKSENL